MNKNRAERRRSGTRSGGRSVVTRTQNFFAPCIYLFWNKFEHLPTLFCSITLLAALKTWLAVMSRTWKSSSMPFFRYESLFVIASNANKKHYGKYRFEGREGADLLHESGYTFKDLSWQCSLYRMGKALSARCRISTSLPRSYFRVAKHTEAIVFAQANGRLPHEWAVFEGRSWSITQGEYESWNLEPGKQTLPHDVLSHRKSSAR